MGEELVIRIESPDVGFFEWKAPQKVQEVFRLWPAETQQEARRIITEYLAMELHTVGVIVISGPTFEHLMRIINGASLLASEACLDILKKVIEGVLPACGDATCTECLLGPV
jgi:hypothetical protein